jgi:N-methylhydantoinase A
MFWVGIDVGGTFTDGVVYDAEAGSFRFAKAPSTPSDPTAAVLDLLALMKVPVEGIDRLVHGVTIGTNAVLTGKGADVWMLVTKGFRDVLEIARTNRPVLYDIRSRKTPPLVPRTRAIEIGERLMSDGSVRTALDREMVRAAVRRSRRSWRRSARIFSSARRRRCCRSSASTNASARPRSMPMSAHSWGAISALSKRHWRVAASSVISAS